MPRSHESYVIAGRIGGTRRAALTVDRRALTAAATAARMQKYLDQVPPEITDPDDRMDRALKLRYADMLTLSSKAATARSKAAELRQAAKRAERELADLQDVS